VVKQIEKMILAAELQPGEKLPSERDLAKQFGVSRTVIREAVKTLQQRGLVEIHQGKGIFIIQPKIQLVTESIRRILAKNDTTLDHLVEAREMLEMAIIRVSARKITDDQLRKLAEFIERMDKRMEDAEAFVINDVQFHVTMAESAQNPVYLLFMNSILELIQKKSISMAFQSPYSMRRAQQHHQLIYQALAERDEIKAVSALQGHFKQIREDVRGIDIQRERG
jgi:GntR family transcriptional regulator, transcriptional repressor for pyruvate dehydrogenase complex